MQDLCAGQGFDGRPHPSPLDVERFRSLHNIECVKDEKPKSANSRGLGDTVAKITKAIGIDWVVKQISGNKDCGCAGRQEALNTMFPYQRRDNG